VTGTVIFKAQPVSEPTLDFVMAKIRQVFPNRAEDEILAQLQAYGTESYEPEKYRVYLAILKLCDEEGKADPASLVELAKQDYRDVLAWAEYPNAAKPSTWGEKDPEKIGKVSKMDLEQYENWLNKK